MDPIETLPLGSLTSAVPKSLALKTTPSPENLFIGSFPLTEKKQEMQT